MQSQNPFFDDIARMMSGAMGVAAGVREEAEAQFRQFFENATSRMDLVRRDEFEAVKAMAAKAREENEALARRVAELEQALAGKAAPKTARKTAAKPSAGSAKRAGQTRDEGTPDTTEGGGESGAEG